MAAFLDTIELDDTKHNVESLMEMISLVESPECHRVSRAWKIHVQMADQL